MSNKLAKEVLQSGLEPHLKLLAIALALYGDEEGERIFPSVGRIAVEVGKSKRQARRGLAELRARNILIPQGQTLTGGRGQRVHYRLDKVALPPRPDWKSAPFLEPPNPSPQSLLSEPKNTRLSPHSKGDTHVPLSEFTEPQKGDAHVPLSVSFSGERGTWGARKEDMGVTRSIRDLPVSTNTSTAAFASVSPTTTERRRKPHAKIPPTFATVCVFVADFMKRAEPGLSDPDLLEDIRNACQRTFDTYDSVQIRDALENVRRESSRVKSPGDRGPSRMTRIADLLPGHLAGMRSHRA